MDAQYQLRFLGPVQLSMGAGTVRGLRSRKALALLGYLAAHDERLSRHRLATLFWPELAEQRALSNLSWILTHLNSQIPGCLSTDRHTVRLQPGAQIWVDLAAFRDLVGQPLPPALARAIELYRGELMEGFYLNDCPDFETWLIYERERWHQRVIHALSTLIIYERNRGDHHQALSYATRFVQLDPCNEEAHRHLMLLLSLNGQRSAALAQFESCRRLLRQELGIEPSEETSTLYQELRAGTLSPPPAPTARQPIVETSAWAHLPSPYTSFIGREDELAQLIRLLADEQTRLVTIVGPGGIGKTRLTLELAQQLCDVFLHGVRVVPLAPIASSAAIIPAIGAALHVAFTGKSEPKSELINALTGKQMLLILDNIEHLLDGAQIVRDLLAGAPQLKCVVTSRERLHLQDERLLTLRGLSFPQDAAGARSHKSSAVQLFLERAQRVNHRFSPDAATLPGILLLCQLLEGNPLGIELAATWADRFSPGEIVAALQANIDLLSTTMSDVPPPHRSMRAVFDRSWELLSPEERRAFAQLSVFRGSFTQEALLAITSVSLLDLRALSNKSLLQRTSAGRYELHELVRYYAEEQLGAAAEDQQPNARTVRDRHSAFYLDLLAQAERAIQGGGSQGATAMLRQDLDNLRQAWHWAAEQGHTGSLETSLQGLSNLYTQLCLFGEAEQLFKLAADQLQPRLSPDKPADRQGWLTLGRLYLEQINFLIRQAFYDRAIALLQLIIPLARRLAEPALEAAGLYSWAHIYFRQGEYEQAHQAVQQALALARELGVEPLEAHARYLCARVLLRQSNYRQAHTQLEQALVIYRKLDDRMGESATLNQLGNAYWYSRDFVTARYYHQLYYERCRELGAPHGIATALHNLAEGSWPLGHYTQARDTFAQVLQIYQDLGDRWGIALTMSNLGHLQILLGAFQQARELLEGSLQLAHEHGIRWVEAQAQANLSFLAYQQGDYLAAYHTSRQAVATAEQLGSRDDQAYAQLQLGHALAGLGRGLEARQTYQQTLALSYELGLLHYAAEALAGLARMALEAGQPEQAQEHVDRLLYEISPEQLRGASQPLLVHLTCFRVLRERHDPRAQAALARAQALRDQIASEIDDPEQRHAFLETVPRFEFPVSS